MREFLLPYLTRKLVCFVVSIVVWWLIHGRIIFSLFRDIFFIDYFVVDINIDRLNGNDIGPLSKWMADLPLMKRYEWTEFGLGRCLREALHQENLLLRAISYGSNCHCGLAWIVP